MQQHNEILYRTNSPQNLQLQLLSTYDDRGNKSDVREFSNIEMYEAKWTYERMTVEMVLTRLLIS